MGPMTRLARNALDLATQTQPAASDDPMLVSADSPMAFTTPHTTSAQFSAAASALNLDAPQTRDHEEHPRSQSYECYICAQYTSFQMKCKVCAELSCPLCRECFEALPSDCTQDPGAELISTDTSAPNQGDPAHYTLVTRTHSTSCAAAKGRT